MAMRREVSSQLQQPSQLPDCYRKDDILARAGNTGTTPDGAAVDLADQGLLDLLARAPPRTVTWGGLYWDGAGGLARSCPLSPLLGAFHLHVLGAMFAQTDLFYVR